MGKKEVFQKFMESYPNKKYSEAQVSRIKALTSNLIDLDFQQLINHLIDTNRYLPSPIDFSENIKALGLESIDNRLKNVSCSQCTEGWLYATKIEQTCHSSEDSHRLFCSKEKCNYPQYTFRCPCPKGQRISGGVMIFDEHRDGKHWKIRR
jgi:hypothetical protein